MAIYYDPKEMLKKAAPEKKLKRLMTGELTLKKAALSFLSDLDFIDKKEVTRVALETLKSYRERIKKAQPDYSDSAAKAARDAASADELEQEIVDEPKLLIQRVQNEIVFQVSKEISHTYYGEKYEWLPSDAEEPDPEHQLKYGKVFTIGEGEMPGERYGCKCGMRILVRENSLELG